MRTLRQKAAVSTTGILIGWLALVGAVSAHAAPFAFRWSGHFAGTQSEFGRSVAVDGSGNVVVTGYFLGVTNFGGPNLTSAGEYDIFVSKFDASGVHQWTQRFGDLQRQYGRSVALDAAGSVIVTGTFGGTVNFGGGDLTSADYLHDVFVAKFDASGLHQWSKRLGGPDMQYASSVAVDGLGNVIVTGGLSGTANFGGADLTSAGDYDIFVAKFDASGVHQWSKRFGDAAPQSSQSVATDAAGNVVITGDFFGTVNFGGGGLTSVGNSGNEDIFVAKFDPAGVHRWSRRFGDSQPQFSRSVATDVAGNVIIAGSFLGTVNFDGANLTSAGYEDIFVAKFDASGLHQWSKRFGGDAADDARSVATDTAGNVIIAGGFVGTVNLGGADLRSEGSYDIFVAEFGASGIHQWSNRFGDPGEQQAQSIAVDASGSVIVTGEFFAGTINFGKGEIHNAGEYDVFVAKFEETPVIQLSGSSITFPAVTFGDTVVAAFVVGNAGDRDLTVADVWLSNPEMRLVEPSLPDTVAKGYAREYIVQLSPRQYESSQCVIGISSNDAFRPRVDIAGETTIHSLAIRSVVLDDNDPLPLAQAVTVVVQSAVDGRLEHAWLYHRTAGRASFERTAMVPLNPVEGSDFVVTIPGSAVTEEGLEFYAEVENSGLFQQDPGGAPVDTFYHRAVAPPASISTSARPTSGAAFIEGREVEIQAALPGGTNFIRGLLYYRRGGENVFELDTLAVSGLLPSAEIRADYVGTRGVEYWVQVETATRLLTDPPNDPASNPRRLQVTTASAAEPALHAGRTYRMVSFPVLFDGSFTGTIEEVLTDEPGLGEYNPERWRSWVWVTEKKGYGELNDASVAGQFRPEPGRAWWLVTKESHRVDTGPVVGKTTPTDRPYEIVLKPGWTMIGDPFAFPVGWEGVFSEGTPAAADTLLSGPYGYSTSGYRKKDRLEPFLGYWVHSDHMGEITLRVPPVEAPATGAPVVATETTGGWTIGIRASAGEATDEAALGVSARASDQRDRFDELDPPMSPGRAVSVFAVAGHPRSRDVRDAATWRRDGGVAWAMDVEKNFVVDRAGDAMTLRFSLDNLPSGERAVLLDRELSREIDLRREPAYSFIIGEHSATDDAGQARFVLAVGSEAYVAGQRDLLPGLPSKTVLHQNTPNPFNPATVIRYDLARASDVTLRIYDLRGALVRNLEEVSRPAGRYEVGWNGENERGELVASGVYFYELRAGAFRQTKKMVLLK